MVEKLESCDNGDLTDRLESSADLIFLKKTEIRSDKEQYQSSQTKVNDACASYSSCHCAAYSSH